MKRHRTKYPNKVNSAYSIFNWNVEDDDWQLTSTQTLPAYHLTESKFSDLEDVDSAGKWNYNDATHVKWQGDYGIIVNDPTVRDSHLQFVDVGPSLALSTRYSVDCGRILMNIHEDLGKSYASPFSAGRVESWFASTLLPTRITVDRDPFDSDFSIWFLLVDLVKLPSLAASLLFRGRVLRHELAGPKTIKSVANDYLGIKFGVEAFYRDLIDFIGIWQRFYDAVIEVEKHTKDIYRWHAAKLDVSSYLPEIPIRTTVKWTNFGTPMFDIDRTRENVSASFTRTMAYRIKCPELRGWLSRLKQFVDLFGILDPAAIWDLLPFSFVLDWFLPIGQWVHSNKPRLFPASIECLDYCESIRTEIRYRYDAYDPAIFSGGTLRWRDFITNYPLYRDIGTEDHVTYLRRRYKPENSRIGQGSRTPMLRLENCVVAASLVAQRLPRIGLIGDEFEGINFSRSPQMPSTPKGFEATEVDRKWAQSMRARKLAKLGVNPALLKFEHVPKPGRVVNPKLPARSARGKVMQWKSMRDLSTGFLPGFTEPKSDIGYFPVAP